MVFKRSIDRGKLKLSYPYLSVIQNMVSKLIAKKKRTDICIISDINFVIE